MTDKKLEKLLENQENSKFLSKIIGPEKVKEISEGKADPKEVLLGVANFITDLKKDETSYQELLSMLPDEYNIRNVEGIKPFIKDVHQRVLDAYLTVHMYYSKMMGSKDEGSEKQKEDNPVNQKMVEISSELIKSIKDNADLYKHFSLNISKAFSFLENAASYLKDSVDFDKDLDTYAKKFSEKLFGNIDPAKIHLMTDFYKSAEKNPEKAAQMYPLLKAIDSEDLILVLQKERKSLGTKLQEDLSVEDISDDQKKELREDFENKIVEIDKEISAIENSIKEGKEDFNPYSFNKSTIEGLLSSDKLKEYHRHLAHLPKDLSKAMSKDNPESFKAFIKILNDPVESAKDILENNSEKKIQDFSRDQKRTTVESLKTLEQFFRSRIHNLKETKRLVDTSVDYMPTTYVNDRGSKIKVTDTMKDLSEKERQTAITMPSANSHSFPHSAIDFVNKAMIRIFGRDKVLKSRAMSNGAKTWSGQDVTENPLAKFEDVIKDAFTWFNTFDEKKAEEMKKSFTEFGEESLALDDKITQGLAALKLNIDEFSRQVKKVTNFSSYEDKLEQLDALTEQAETQEEREEILAKYKEAKEEAEELKNNIKYVLRSIDSLVRKSIDTDPSSKGFLTINDEAKNELEDMLYTVGTEGKLPSLLKEISSGDLQAFSKNDLPLVEALLTNALGVVRNISDTLPEIHDAYSKIRSKIKEVSSKVTPFKDMSKKLIKAFKEAENLEDFRALIYNRNSFAPTVSESRMKQAATISSPLEKGLDSFSKAISSFYSAYESGQLSAIDDVVNSDTHTAIKEYMAHYNEAMRKKSQGDEEAAKSVQGINKGYDLFNYVNSLTGPGSWKKYVESIEMFWDSIKSLNNLDTILARLDKSVVTRLEGLTTVSDALVPKKKKKKKVKTAALRTAAMLLSEGRGVEARELILKVAQDGWESKIKGLRKEKKEKTLDIDVGSLTNYIRDKFEEVLKVFEEEGELSSSFKTLKDISNNVLKLKGFISDSSIRTTVDPLVAILERKSDLSEDLTEEEKNELNILSGENDKDHLEASLSAYSSLLDNLESRLAKRLNKYSDEKNKAVKTKEEIETSIEELKEGLDVLETSGKFSKTDFSKRVLGPSTLLSSRFDDLKSDLRMLATSDTNKEMTSEKAFGDGKDKRDYIIPSDTFTDLYKKIVKDLSNRDLSYLDDNIKVIEENLGKNLDSMDQRVYVDDLLKTLRGYKEEEEKGFDNSFGKVKTEYKQAEQNALKSLIHKEIINADSKGAPQVVSELEKILDSNKNLKDLFLEAERSMIIDDDGKRSPRKYSLARILRHWPDKGIAKTIRDAMDLHSKGHDGEVASRILRNGLVNHLNTGTGSLKKSLTEELTRAARHNGTSGAFDLVRKSIDENKALKGHDTMALLRNKMDEYDSKDLEKDKDGLLSNVKDVSSHILSMSPGHREDQQEVYDLARKVVTSLKEGDNINERIADEIDRQVVGPNKKKTTLKQVSNAIKDMSLHSGEGSYHNIVKALGSKGAPRTEVLKDLKRASSLYGAKGRGITESTSNLIRGRAQGILNNVKTKDTTSKREESYKGIIDSKRKAEEISAKLREYHGKPLNDKQEEEKRQLMKELVKAETDLDFHQIEYDKHARGIKGPSASEAKHILNSFSDELLSQVSKDKAEIKSLRTPGEDGKVDPKNEEMAAHLEEMVENNLNLISANLGNSTKGAKRGNKQLAERAVEHYTNEAQKARDELAAANRYITQKETDPEKAAKTKEEWNLEDEPDTKSMAERFNKMLHKAESVNSHILGGSEIKLKGGLVSNMPEHDLIQQVGFDDAIISSNVSMNTNSKYIVPAAKQFLSQWIKRIQAEGLASFFDKESFSKFLEEAEEKLLKHIRRDFTKEALEGVEVNGIRYDGQLDILKKEREKWEKVIEGYKREIKEISEAHHEVLSGLGDIFMDTTSQAQEFDQALGDYQKSIDDAIKEKESKEELARSGFLLDDEGMPVSIPEDDPDFVDSLAFNIKAENELRGMNNIDFQNLVRSVKSKLQKSAEDGTVLRFSSREKYMLGPQLVDKLSKTNKSNVQEVAKKALSEHSDVFADHKKLAKTIEDKLTMLVATAPGSEDLKNISFTEEERDLMGKTIYDNVDKILKGDAKPTSIGLSGTIKKVNARANKLLTAQKTKHFKTLGGSKLNSKTRAIKDLIDDLHDSTKIYEQSMEELDDQISNLEDVDEIEQAKEEKEYLTQEFSKHRLYLKSAFTKLELPKDIAPSKKSRFENVVKDLKAHFDDKGDTVRDLPLLSQAIQDFTDVSPLNEADMSVMRTLENDVNEYRTVLRTEGLDPESYDKIENRKKDLTRKIAKGLSSLKKAGLDSLYDNSVYQATKDKNEDAILEDIQVVNDLLDPDNDNGILAARDFLSDPEFVKAIKAIRSTKLKGAEEARGKYSSLVRKWVYNLDVLSKKIRKGSYTADDMKDFSDKLIVLRDYVYKDTPEYLSGAVLKKVKDAMALSSSKALDLSVLDSKAADKGMNTSITKLLKQIDNLEGTHEEEDLDEIREKAMKTFEGRLKNLHLAKTRGMEVDPREYSSIKKEVYKLSTFYPSLLELIDDSELKTFKDNVKQEIEDNISKEMLDVQKQYEDILEKSKEDSIVFLDSEARNLSARIKDLLSKPVIKSNKLNTETLENMQSNLEESSKDLAPKLVEKWDGNVTALLDKYKDPSRFDEKEIEDIKKRYQNMIASLSRVANRVIGSGSTSYYRKVDTLIKKVKDAIKEADSSIDPVAGLKTRVRIALDAVQEIRDEALSNPGVYEEGKTKALIEVIKDLMRSPLFDPERYPRHKEKGLDEDLKSLKEAEKFLSSSGKLRTKKAADGGDYMGGSFDAQHHRINETIQSFPGQSKHQEDHLDTDYINKIDTNTDHRKVVNLLMNAVDRDVMSKQNKGGKLLERVHKNKLPPSSLRKVQRKAIESLKTYKARSALRKGLHAEFDNDAAVLHGLLTHQENKKAKAPGRRTLSDNNFKLLEGLQKKWDKLGKGIIEHDERLNSQIKEIEKDDSLDAIEKDKKAKSLKEHKKLNRSSLDKHQGLRDKGHSYVGDEAHTIHKDMVVTILEISDALEEIHEIVASGDTAYKGDLVKAEEVEAKFMQRLKDLGDHRIRLNNMLEHAQKMLEEVISRQDRVKEMLSHAKTTGKGGLTPQEEKMWTQNFLGQVMHWMMWIWERNKGVFETAFNATNDDYEKFMKIHQDKLGIFNNPRINKNIVWVSERLKDPNFLPDRHRTQYEKDKVRKLLELRRRLFQYKYSLAHSANIEDTIREIAMKDNLEVDFDDSNYQRGIQHLKKGASEVASQFNQAVDELKKEVEEASRTAKEAVSKYASQSTGLLTESLLGSLIRKFNERNKDQ